MESKCLIIIGMHRSGTSLTASILQKAGLNIGSELLEAGEGNIKGHFEDCHFYNFHKKALLSLSLNSDGWDLNAIEELNEHLDAEASLLIKKNSAESWGWKDPRTTLFLDFWKKKLPEANCLFIYRNPWEVVDSLYKRNSDSAIIKDPWKAFKAWDFYNREIIKMYKKHKDHSLLIQIDDIIANTSAFIERVNQQLGFNLQAEKATNIFDKSIYGRSFRHNYLKSIQTAFVFPEAIDTLNELRMLTNKNEFRISNDSLLRHSIVSNWQGNNFANKLNVELHRTYKECEKLKAQIELCEKEVFWMKKTKLWKIRKALVELKTSLYNSFVFNFKALH